MESFDHIIEGYYQKYGGGRLLKKKLESHHAKTSRDKRVKSRNELGRDLNMTFLWSF